METITIDIPESGTINLGPTLTAGQVAYSGTATGWADYRPVRRVQARRLPWWFGSLEPRLTELLNLPSGWKSPGSERVSIDDLVDALNFLETVMREDTIVPWVGPLDNGGVEVLWKHGDVEVEAIFDHGQGERQLLVSVGDHDWEEPIEHAQSLFATVVDRLTTDSVSAAA
jgi:hypothetical protein